MRAAGAPHTRPGQLPPGWDGPHGHEITRPAHPGPLRYVMMYHQPQQLGVVGTFGSKKTDEEKAAAKRMRQITGAAAQAGLTVFGGKFRAPNQEPVPVDGARITIELGEQARKRITATRVALIGIFALWAKKDMQQLFITIENGDQVMLCPVPAKKEGAARVLATMINGDATEVTKSE